MKRRLSAVLLAVGLSFSALSMGVYAEETENMATEQVTEAVSEAADESGQTAQTEAANAEDMAKSLLESQLSQISGWTDEQIEQLLESGDMTSEAIAANWKSVKGELGAFVEVTDAELTEDGTGITGHAKYEKVDDKTSVSVVYTVNPEAQTAAMNWEIEYPMGIMMQRAGLNTVMGLGIVFLTLLFLSWLIGRLHIIPDMIEKKAKKNEPAPAAVPAAQAPVQAPVEEEEELVDDLELVAVITAAIAASENTSSDGFVVRSIKKANKRNWQRA